MEIAEKQMVKIEGATFVQVKVGGETELLLSSSDIEDYDEVRVEIHDERELMEDDE